MAELKKLEGFMLFNTLIKDGDKFFPLEHEGDTMVIYPSLESSQAAVDELMELDPTIGEDDLAAVGVYSLPDGSQTIPLFLMREEIFGREAA